MKSSLFKNLCIICLIVAVCFFVQDAWASGSRNPFEMAIVKIKDAFLGAKKVVYALGAFIIISLAFGAFLGKVKWSHVAYLAGGLTALAIAGYILDYLVTENPTAGQDSINAGTSFEGW